MIKLPDRDMVIVIPMLHSIAGNMHTAVVPQNHMAWIFIVDPECMVIDVNSIAATVPRKSLSSIARSIQTRPAYINIITIQWIDLDVAVIHRSRVK